MYDKNDERSRKCNPQDYLPCMIRMMKEVEKDKVMIYNVFPMRNDIIMKSIKIDITTLVHLLMTKKQGNKTDYLLEGVKVTKYYYYLSLGCK